PRDILMVMFDYVLDNLEGINQRWEYLHEYLQKVISERSALLDPPKHDRLLSDDEYFSRSKAYF
ncbi:hypothetical protein L207DRAFT_400800, partial [Hyaloscypha variabilis F]